MNLVGAVIKHATFGEGTIISLSGKYLDVAFADGKKEFLYPHAFSKYITAVDAKVAAYAKAEVAKFEATEGAISENKRLERVAAQAAHWAAAQKALTAAKQLKKKSNKAVAKETNGNP